MNPGGDSGRPRAEPAYLRPHGRVLLFFGTNGHFDFLTDLLARAGWASETAATCDLTIDDHTVTYSTLRLTR